MLPGLQVCYIGVVERSCFVFSVSQFHSNGSHSVWQRTSKGNSWGNKQPWTFIYLFFIYVYCKKRQHWWNVFGVCFIRLVSEKSAIFTTMKGKHLKLDNQSDESMERMVWSKAYLKVWEDERGRGRQENSAISSLHLAGCHNTHTAGLNAQSDLFVWSFTLYLKCNILQISVWNLHFADAVCMCRWPNAIQFKE